MRQDPIYTVTSITKPCKEGRIQSRTWGFFHDEALAIQACLMNAGDLTECYYEHLLVQEVFPGGMGYGPMLTETGPQRAWFDVVYLKGGDGPTITAGVRPDFIGKHDTFGFE